MLHLYFPLEHTDVETFFFFFKQKINSSVKTGLNFDNEFTHYVGFADFDVGREIHPITWKEFLDLGQVSLWQSMHQHCPCVRERPRRRITLPASTQGKRRLFLERYQKTHDPILYLRSLKASLCLLHLKWAKITENNHTNTLVWGEC